MEGGTRVLIDIPRTRTLSSGCAHRTLRNFYPCNSNHGDVYVLRGMRTSHGMAPANALCDPGLSRTKRLYMRCSIDFISRCDTPVASSSSTAELDPNLTISWINLLTSAPPTALGDAASRDCPRMTGCLLVHLCVSQLITPPRSRCQLRALKRDSLQAGDEALAHGIKPCGANRYHRHVPSVTLNAFNSMDESSLLSIYWEQICCHLVLSYCVSDG